MLRQFQVGRRKYLRSDELAEECDCRDDYRIVIGKTINVGILRTENDLYPHGKCQHQNGQVSALVERLV